MSRLLLTLISVAMIPLLSACGTSTIEMDSSFYAMETALLDRDGVWQYSTKERYYDGDKKCLVKKLDLQTVEPKGPAIPEPPNDIIWKVHVGRPKQGISYGFVTGKPKREIAYKNGRWFWMPNGSLKSLKEIFERECMVERTQ